ncbi:putative MFS family arabinose efflux permease [Paraburkholderia terricola]|jgi:predicted MFS family arabinose efflux permease|uniref:MFS transporter n=1 Tax=Paraburkholderia terricola TaxID=169427 RepID=UPI00285C6185|nr:MFS transporter [Paraburkholderia terricola]MDR6495705.1 putative MFS family arabinose efflux permease [Paraburkholderia terricola]
MNLVAKRLDGRMHYSWVVVGVVFLVLLAAAGTRATPSVMMVPLERQLGWSRDTISLAISINLALYGLTGPFAAAAMQRFGVRPTLLAALATLAAGVGISSMMTKPWQMVLVWGVMVGSATGVAALTLSATVINRWFTTHRGLAMGILSASSATGQLIFLPFLASISEQHGWRPVVLVVAAAVLIVLPVVAWLLPERPLCVGLRPVGESAETPTGAPPALKNPIKIAFGTLAMASKTRDFWLLFFSFFICGASTNGYIGTHFIAMCSDYGFTQVQGATLLATMGIFDLVGTTLSGWLSDRFNARYLLFWYYGLRGLSLIYLPYAFGIDFFGLPVFAVFYGLDWIATVPPTVRLVTDVYGKDTAPIVFGWVVAGHQLGAAFAALGAGMLRSSLGSYTIATMISGGLCLFAALFVLRINLTKRLVGVAAN